MRKYINIMGIKINTEMEPKESTEYRSLTWFGPKKDNMYQGEWIKPYKQTLAISKSTNIPITYRPKGKEDLPKIVKQIYDRSNYKNGGIIKIQNGGFTAKQQEDNKSFFEDFAKRYNKLHGVDKSSVIQETLKKETPVIDPNGKGNRYYPHKDEIHLVSTNSPAHFTHEFVHKLNDSLPPRLERSQEEVDLLTEAYPLGKLQNSSKRYQKYAGNIEHFTTNTTLRRNISDKNNGVLGEDLNKVILEMPAKELGIEAGGSGYASPRDYFEFKPEVNSVGSYYKAMGNETP